MATAGSGTTTVQRWVAVCNVDACDFNARPEKQTHMSEGQAEREAATHHLKEHAQPLAKQVTVRRERKVIDEKIVE